MTTDDTTVQMIDTPDWGWLDGLPYSVEQIRSMINDRETDAQRLDAIDSLTAKALQLTAQWAVETKPRSADARNAVLVETLKSIRLLLEMKG